jgi:hypothetical protein
VVIIPLSAFVIEMAKLCYAESIGYTSEYSKSTGRLSYSSPDMQTSFKGVQANYSPGSEEHRESAEWQQLVHKDTADHTKIEMAGKLITFLISAIGLLVYFARRRYEKKMSWLDWLSVILGLVFMRDVVINTINLFNGFMTCHEAKLWHHLNLPIFTSTAIYNGVGLLLFCFILYKIPKSNRSLFIISGIIGTILGGLLWLVWLGDLML